MLGLPQNKKLNSDSGLSLLETLGVVSIGAVLAAITLPHVHDLIADSRAESLASSVKVYQQAISRYFGDVGVLLPLDHQGVPHLETSGDSINPRSLPARLTLVASDPQVGSTNLWPKFRGPYLEKFDTDHPPEVGGKMYLPTMKALPLGTSVTGNNQAWDLKGDDGKNDLPTKAVVAMLRVTNLTQDQFLRFDRIIEPDIGSTQAERPLRGRAKYDPTSRTLSLYLAHQ